MKFLEFWQKIILGVNEMTPKDKVLNLEAGLIGNRFAALGNSIMFGYYGAFANEFWKVSEYHDFSAINSTMGFLGLTFAGAAISGYNAGGWSTKKIYNKTKKHVKRFGKIDERFFRVCLGDDSRKKLTGYCQLQGMYLACRDYAPECLSEFYDLKTKHTKNMVPNF